MTDVTHLRNGSAQRHRWTLGDGVTWCGKKLIGKPEQGDDGAEVFNTYGNRLIVASDPARGSCQRCREAFDTAYAAAFPDGLKPIATFRTDDPADMACARAALSPEALTGFFGPGGGGISAFMAALEETR